MPSVMAPSGFGQANECLVSFQSYTTCNSLPASPTSSSRRSERTLVSSSTSSVRSLSSESRPSRGRSRTMRKPRLVTEAEFQQLPANIQRKCFSSFERLKIAQQSSLLLADNSVLSPTHNTILSVSSSRRSFRSTKNRTVRDDQILAQAEAHFFLSLPEKVRRQHFSREEQATITARLEFVNSNPVDIPNSATKQSLRTLRTRREHRRGYSVGTLPQKRSFSTRASSTSSNANSLDLPRPTLEVQPLHNFPVLPPLPAIPNKLRRTTTTRRNVSLPRPPVMHTYNASVSSTPASPRISRHGHTRSLSVGAHIRSSNETTSPSIDNAAVHYQNPEARMKLRNYLASPQKFDEAVEFGFPSTPVLSPDSEQDYNPWKAHRSTSANDAQQFLKDDSISFIDQYESQELPDDDDVSSAAPSSPTTPNDPEDSMHRYAESISNRSLFSPLDNFSLPPLNLTSYKSQSDTFSAMVNREMTLRMTLTRPDLRAPEDVLYGWQGEAHHPVDLLALEDLPISDDITGSHSPFAVKEPRNAGVLKRWFGRGRSRDKKR